MCLRLVRMPWKVEVSEDLSLSFKLFKELYSICTSACFDRKRIAYYVRNCNEGEIEKWEPAKCFEGSLFLTGRL